MNTHAQAIARYVSEIDKIYRTGNATEHSYRFPLKMIHNKLKDKSTANTLTEPYEGFKKILPHKS
jgi:hypothetical protein